MGSKTDFSISLKRLTKAEKRLLDQEFELAISRLRQAAGENKYAFSFWLGRYTAIKRLFDITTPDDLSESVYFNLFTEYVSLNGQREVNQRENPA